LANPMRETRYWRVRKVIPLTRADILMLGKRDE
jgi:hypothetical protein